MKEVKYYKLGKLKDVAYFNTTEECENYVENERKDLNPLNILNNELKWIIQ